MWKKVLFLVALLGAVILTTTYHNPDFVKPFNLTNNVRWIGLYGVLALGQAFVIITSGIDLSVGSIVGLVGSLLPLLVRELGVPLWLGLTAVLALALALGLGHGLLVTKLRLSAFVVTLCGLFMYRGLARYFTGDATQGFGGSEFEGLKVLAKGKPFAVPVPFSGMVDLPMPFVILAVLAVAAAVFLNLSVHGRYLLALGRNEQAARYSGIHTDRLVVAAYAISAGMAGVAGVLLGLDVESVQPSSHGVSLELYAIAGAVLGGCSLRGGEGSILGVILGTALVVILRNAINVAGIETQLEFAVIGAVILAGVTADELVKRVAARRRAVREARIPPPSRGA